MYKFRLTLNHLMAKMKLKGNRGDGSFGSPASIVA